MKSRKASQRLVFATVLILVVQGCVVPQKHFVRSTPLASHVTGLVKGKTTTDEVLRRLGLPDIEADGATSRVNTSTPLGQYWGGYLHASREWSGLFPYSAIDSERLLLLYLEIQLMGPAVLKRAEARQGYHMGYGLGRVLRNKLLVLIDKRTGVVSDVTYHEEFDTK